jgi:hypothetical protein
MVDDRPLPEPVEGAAQRLGDRRMQLRHAGGMALVEHRAVPRHARRLPDGHPLEAESLTTPFGMKGALSRSSKVRSASSSMAEHVAVDGRVPGDGAV